MAATPRRKNLRQLPVAPAYALFPLLQWQQRAPLSGHPAHELGSPGIVLPALGTHGSVGGAEFLRVTRDSAASVQVRRLERADHRPSQTEAVAHDAIDVLHAGYPIANQAVRLSQHGALQAIEDKSPDLVPEHDGGKPDRFQAAARAIDDGPGGERCGYYFDHAQQEGRIRRMRHEAALASGELGRELRSHECRRGARKYGIHRSSPLELREEFALEIKSLRCTFLDVADAVHGTRQRFVQRDVLLQVCFGAGYETSGLQVLPARVDRLAQAYQLHRVRVVNPHAAARGCKQQRERRADAACPKNGDGVGVIVPGWFTSTSRMGSSGAHGVARPCESCAQLFTRLPAITTEMMDDLSGRTILVTGASKGIGAAIASRLGAAGAHVIAHYGSDVAGAQHATRDIPEGRRLLVAADLSDLDQAEKLWQSALAWRGGIDVFVNNAATMLWNGGVEESLETWDFVWEQTLRVNVLAPARLMRQAVLHFRERRAGVIVTISSWAAQRGSTNPATIAYAASKSAVHAATKTIARAYAREGILAYTIAPGVVRTRLSEQFAATQGGEDRITSSLAMGEWVPPAEIADLVGFLATGRARQLSGATLDINGASYIR